MNIDTTLRVKCEHCGGTFDIEVFKILKVGVLKEGSYAECYRCACMSKLPAGSLEELMADQPPESDPRNLRYTTCTPYSTSAPDVLDIVTVPGLRAPVVAFNNNLSRLRSLNALPVTMAWVSRLAQRITDECLDEVMGDFRKNANDEQDAELKQLFSEKWAEWFRVTEERSSRAAFVQKFGVDTLNMLHGAPLWNGLEAVLIAQLTGAWTAFETLAGDLWEAALNVHPRGLAALKGKRPKKTKVEKPQQPPDAAVESKKERGKKYVPLSRLTEHRYDVATKMGSVLKGRYEFSKLDSLRDAYWEAFESRGGVIKSCIMSQCVDALHAVRNVIVHNAGAVDRVSRRQIRQIPGLGDIECEERIPVDGTFVDRLVTPVLFVSVALIGAVDEWINPKDARD